MKKIVLGLLILAGISSVQATEIKVVVAVNHMTEKTRLGDYSMWKLAGKLGETTTLEKLYEEGWRLIEAVRTDNSDKDTHILLFLER